MSYKKKFFAISILFIIILQIFLYSNNTQKSTFRYFIWNIKEISIGKLICISFMSGLIISTTLNKILTKDIKLNSTKEDEDSNEQKEDYINNEDLNDNFEIPPQRDVRETQPTISVNYRVVKNTGKTQKNRSEIRSNNLEIEEDWEDSNTEW